MNLQKYNTRTAAKLLNQNRKSLDIQSNEKGNFDFVGPFEPQEDEVHTEVSAFLLKKNKKLFSYDYVSRFDTLSINDANFVMSKYANNDSDLNNSLPYFDCDDASSVDTCSVITGSTLDDAYSDVTYQSSIYNPLKRRKLTTFNDVSSSCSDSTHTEYMSDVLEKSNIKCEEVARKSNNSAFNVKNDIDGSWKLKYFIFSFLLIFIIILLTLVILPTCQFHSKYTLPLRSIEGNLTNCLIGHELSVPTLIETLYNFNFGINNFQRIYFIWLVGPIGVGKSLAKQLIKNSLDSSVKSFSILSALLSNDIHDVENQINNLVKRLDNCKPNIIFIDGFDNENDGTLKYLELLFEHLKQQHSSQSQLRVLVIVLGTYKSYRINQFYLNHIKLRGDRFTLNYKDLQAELTRDTPFDNFKHNLNFTIIPFLPLEASHLEKCILHQLNYISKNKRCYIKPDDELEKYLNLNNFTTTDIQERVFNIYNIETLSYGTIVPLGCKRVYQMVSSVLFPLSNK